MMQAALDWISHNIAPLGGTIGAVVGCVALYLKWRADNPRPKLHFKMWAEIEPSSTAPRETIRYSFRNSGTAPVHIVNVEGDNGFTFNIDQERDYFDPVTIEVHPEPHEGYVVVDFVEFMRKRPTRIWAVDSAGKKWPLSKEDLSEVYKVVGSFRKKPRQ